MKTNLRLSPSSLRLSQSFRITDGNKISRGSLPDHKISLTSRRLPEMRSRM